MKTYPITNTSTESIEFKVLEDRYALVHKSISSLWEVKTIILNKREIMALYLALQQVTSFDNEMNYGGEINVTNR